MPEIVYAALVLAIAAPLAGALGVGLRALLDSHPVGEPFAYRVIGGSLVASMIASVVVLGCYAGVFGVPVRGDVEFGDWLRIRDIEIAAVLLVDGLSVTLSLFAAVLTAFVARFSRSYLHKEPGFVRFFVLLGIFGAGVQLVAFAGALELFFAGWELIGISSALFIGFFHERDEPVRSSVRAFATYRLSDAGLLIATVAALELLGTARFSALEAAAPGSIQASTFLALLFLISACGKSAQLPFSGWLPRAMEGPTPSSALFYGAVSIHAGLFLLLRVWPVLEVAVPVRAAGVVIGVSTAIYAAAVARTNTDAKGALAHATLSQVGLIFAEICLGWITLALVHLVCHALLRLGQYLKAPNTLHDTHRIGHQQPSPTLLQRWSPPLAARVYAGALNRLRLDDRIDAAFAPVMALAQAIARSDQWLRRTLSLDRPTQ